MWQVLAETRLGPVNLTLESKHADAGPYQIASRWQYFVKFGNRTPAAYRSGTQAQYRAFDQARAAFEALRLMQDVPGIDSAREVAELCKMAAKAARETTQSFDRKVSKLRPGEVLVHGVAAYEREVDRRFLDMAEAAGFEV
jgi:hypothetical protein